MIISFEVRSSERTMLPIGLSSTLCLAEEVWRVVMKLQHCGPAQP